MKLTVAAILVSRGMKVLQAAPAAYPYRSDLSLRLTVQTEVNPDFAFDGAWFASQLAERTAWELDFWQSRWTVETIRALAFDVAPWHASICICLLTTRETFPEEQVGKWALGDWRLHDFTASTRAPGWPAVKELEQVAQAYYQGHATTDSEKTLEQRADVIFHWCAMALLSEQVAISLKRYRLSDDFEFGVFDPDDPSKPNFCHVP